MAIGTIVVIVIFGAPMLLFVLAVIWLSLGLSFALVAEPFHKTANTGDGISKTKKVNHKPYDYWDDAGDGSGVNYVPMADGSVRID